MRLLQLFAIFDIEAYQPICYLPAKPVYKASAPPPKEPGVYKIDPENAPNLYGFKMDKQGERDGSVRYLTEYDKDELKRRGLWGVGKSVTAQNETCKGLWHAGESVMKTAATMSLSDSWVEKRYAAFGRALELELSCK